MTNSFDDAINEYIGRQEKSEHTANYKIEKLLNLSRPATVEPTKEKRTYYIEVNDDTHWELVRIAAKQKLHQEDFVEQLLVEFVAGVHAATAANKAK